MSTNFYAVKVPSSVEYGRMQEALANRQLEKLRELIDESTKEWHIGRRSGGWQFLFESCQSGAPWKEDSLKSIQEFLNRPDIRIKNEYGVCFEPYTFWDEEVGESLYHDSEKYINGEDYDDIDPQHKKYHTWMDTEFTNSEGVRFSKSKFC